MPDPVDPTQPPPPPSPKPEIIFPRPRAALVDQIVEYLRERLGDSSLRNEDIRAEPVAHS